ncbi:TPA: hypothetical protein RQK01_001717 [Vibrio vulnificus]|nr:hypothetical protein [Vibrio vulnificus]
MKMHVLRSRTSQHVAYYAHRLESGIADTLRNRGQVMRKAMFWNFAVDIPYPEALLVGHCFTRTSKNLPQTQEHTIYQAENGEFVAYFMSFEEARQGVKESPKLDCARITEVIVMVPDIEALAHGVPVKISEKRCPRVIQADAVDNFWKFHGVDHEQWEQIDFPQYKQRVKARIEEHKASGVVDPEFKRKIEDLKEMVENAHKGKGIVIKTVSDAQTA